jgi:hypothetical protein
MVTFAVYWPALLETFINHQEFGTTCAANYALIEEFNFLSFQIIY